MNQLYQQLNNNQSLKRPSQLLQQQVMQNPRLQEAINLVKQNGGNAEQVFYQLAKQKGVNPQQILNMINSSF